MLRVLAAAVLTASACGTPQCDPISSDLQGVCHRADAGAMTPDASFVLQGFTFATGTCVVTIDGGQIDLRASGALASCGGSGASLRAASEKVVCTIPPLAPGTYSVNSQPPLTFTLPASADAGIPPCL